MPKAISILFGAAITIGAVYSLGRILLQRLKASFSREEEHLFGLLAGAAAFSLLIFVVAAAHALYDPVLLTLSLGLILWAWRSGALRSSSQRLEPLPTPWRWLFWILYGIFAVIAVIYAMAPEWSPDGSGYHLGVIARHYRAHGFEKITSNMYANLPQGLEMIFLNAWAFGRHSSAALVHAAFLLALPLLMLRFGQRFKLPAAGAAAALFVLASPVVLIDGASAYNDVAAACVIFAVFYLCEMDAPAPLIGLLAGFCFAIKYTAFLAVIYALVRFALKRRWRGAFVVAAAAAVVIVPWVAREWIWYGNPFSPLLNAWFPNPYVHVSFEQDYTEQMRHYSGLDSYWALPLELTIRGRVLVGFLGPLFLLSPIALFSLRSALGRRLLAAAALFALPYAANVGTRFLIPSLPFLSLAMALAFPTRLAMFALPLLATLHCAASFPDVPSLYADHWAWRIQRIPLRQALGEENRDGWLAYKWPPFRTTRMVENATKPGDVIFAFSPIPDSYTSREVIASFQSARGEKLRDHVLVALISDFQASQQLEFRFPSQKLSALRVVQTADPKPGSSDSKDIWSVFEFRILDQGRELPRESSWRLWAQPNPWDVQDAFDNSPLTRWRSWYWIRPGMYVQVDFGKPLSADTVRLDVSTDQYAVRLKLMGQDPSGRWVDLSDKPVSTGLAPAMGLRRAAVEELKRDGVTHLLISFDDFQADDYEKNAELWGIRQVGAVDNMRLYKLE